MSAGEQEFIETFAAWAQSTETAERTALEESLRANLRETWANSGAHVKILILNFIHEAKQEDYDLVVEAMRDSEPALARTALGTVALLVWEGCQLESEVIREELQSFLLRDPESGNVCASILRRLDINSGTI
jgi:hypothetical protein